MRWFCLMLAPSMLLPGAILAHPAQYTTLQVTVDADGKFHGSLNIDILAYALGETSLESTNEELQTLLDGPRAVLGQKLADAGDRFRREVVIRTDAGKAAPSAWELPGLLEVNAVLARKIQPPILMPGEIDFTGALPLSAHRLAIRLPYILGETMQVFELPNGDSNAAPVPAGAYSADIPVSFSPPGKPVKVTAPAPRAEQDPALHVAKAVGSALVVAVIFLAGSRLILFFKKAAKSPS